MGGVLQHLEITTGCCLGTNVNEIVGKEHVGDAVVCNVIGYTVREITEVYDVDFFESAEEERWKGVAVAIFEDHESASVFLVGDYADGACVASHECAIGSATSVAVWNEERTRRGLAFACSASILSQGVSYELCGVGIVLGQIVDKVLGGSFHGQILRKCVHRSNVIVHHLWLIFGQW